MRSTDYKLQILPFSSVACYWGNLLGNKLIEVFGIVTLASLLGIPIFLITDIVEEVKGKMVTIFLHVGFLSLYIAFFLFL